jgi:hypothetical protein
LIQLKGAIEMELSKAEVILVEEVTNEANESSMFALNEIQLALVGGGSGETILH